MSTTSQYKDLYENMGNLGSVFYISIRHLLKISYIYMFWLFLHSLTANLYSYYCAYPSISGIFYSMLFAPSPHCRILFFLTDIGSQMIQSFWISVSIWLVTEIMKKHPYLNIRKEYLDTKNIFYNSTKYYHNNNETDKNMGSNNRKDDDNNDNDNNDINNKKYEKLNVINMNNLRDYDLSLENEFR